MGRSKWVFFLFCTEAANGLAFLAWNGSHEPVTEPRIDTRAFWEAAFWLLTILYDCAAEEERLMAERRTCLTILAHLLHLWQPVRGTVRCVIAVLGIVGA